MNTQDLITMQIVMFLLMLLGMVLTKKQVISKEGKKCLTELLVNLIIPCNIIYAFSLSGDEKAMENFAVILLVAVSTCIFSVLLSAVAYNRMPHDEKKVMQYATVVSNAGFMGNAVAEGIFGPLGLLYTAVYIIPQRIFMWSIGLTYFNTDNKGKGALKKALTHPCIVAVYIGLLIMIFHIPLPGALGLTVQKVSSCCTALSMFVIGAILAEVDLRTVVTAKTLAYCGVRLIGIPIVTLGACMLLGADALVTGVAVVLAGMPAGATTSILAAQHNVAEQFAVKIVVLSTALSMVTIPLWGLFMLTMGLI